MMSHHEVARDTAEVGLMRMVRTLAVILPSLALVQVLAYSRDYRQPAAAVVVWLAVLGAGAWLVPRLRTGGLAAGETAAAVLIAVAAVAAIGAAHRAHGASASVDLAILGTVWLLVLVVMSHPARKWIPGALLVFAVHGALLIRDGGLNPLSLSQLEAAGYIIAIVLTAFAVLRPTLDVHVSMAARQASLASRSAAERAAAAAIQQERKSRLAVLEQEALPLLRDIADGTLDPTKEGVSEECARHAAVLRHSLTGGAPAGGGLMAGLEPALGAAAARDLPVAVQVIGDPGLPATGRPRGPGGGGCRDQRASAASGHAHRARFRRDVELYLTFSVPLRTAPDLRDWGWMCPRRRAGTPAWAQRKPAADASRSAGGRTVPVDRRH